ncbi:unnamed protein product [Pleuronectes platessa]|uniref:Uncharacterized protein n=1 Tax=Pleuronectes platessa TaxID=8262 RepID=A0A9N7TXM7_PLEPL|nr:unnamed protein product [Pleuronectes platessa]
MAKEKKGGVSWLRSGCQDPARFLREPRALVKHPADNRPTNLITLQMAETRGWHCLLFLMSCAYTTAKHLEPPCGLSIWPTPYLPEPDAPKQLDAVVSTHKQSSKHGELLKQVCGGMCHQSSDSLL